MSGSNRDLVSEVMEGLRPLFDDLESQRQFGRKRIRQGQGYLLMAGGICAVGGFLLGVIISAAGGAFIFGLVMGVIGFVISWVMIHRNVIGGHKAFYLNRFKGELLPQVVRHLYPEMNYEPRSGASKALFQGSELVKGRIDRYRSEDLFHGKVGATGLWFSEVKAEREDSSTDAKGNRTTRWVTLFDGLFMVADFHKHFRTWVSVMPDVAERNFGWIGKAVQNLGGGIVRLENPEFEQAFVVRGGDQVEARYILTPDMQERLLQMRRFFGAGLKLVFKQSSVCLVFSRKGNWFEMNYDVPSWHRGQIDQFVQQVSWCCGVVEMLNLNTRIWTKE